MNDRDADLPRAGRPPVRAEGPAPSPPSPPAARPGISPWLAPTGVAAALALGWIVLAVRSPTTTYHVAPLLITVAPLWVVRRTAAHSRAQALTWVAVGVAIAAATTLLLAVTGNLRGPTVTGSRAAPSEAFVAAAFGAVLAPAVTRSRPGSR